MFPATNFSSEINLSASTILASFLKLDVSKQEALREKVEVAIDPEAGTAQREDAEKAILAALELRGVPRPGARTLSREERLSREQLALREKLEQQESEFAEKLCGLMAERQITQAELARRIGVGQSAVSMLLSRKCRPQPRTLGKIAAALGVTVEEFWPGKVEP